MARRKKHLTRKFGGETYKPVPFSWARKSGAKAYRKALSKKGWNARVVELPEYARGKSGNRWGVFARKR